MPMIRETIVTTVNPAGDVHIAPLWAPSAGFVYDQSPQPDSDVGPLLPDSIRRGYCLGFGYNGEHFGLDVADMYLPFQDRTTHVNGDNFNGSYKLTANLIGVNVRLSF